MSNPPIQRALISVSDKLGLVDFASTLDAAGIEIYSTGGTRRHLEEHGIRVHDVSQYTGFPEMLEGRLKTLHPKVFGGILCRHDRDDDLQALQEQGIVSFELVVVNLYPFEATVGRDGVTRAEAIEQIDIGGPSLVRAAAKNHQFVTIVTQPGEYSSVVEEIAATGHTTRALRERLAGEAFARTAAYDLAISAYFGKEEQEAAEESSRFPATEHMLLTRKGELRYGENPHQAAALYREVGARGPSLVAARQLNGKELSYNNLLDLDSALAMARSFLQPAVCVVKHNNPCGAATDERLDVATQKALDGDPLSAFGSVLGINRTVDVATAEVLSQPGLFIEAIVAPDFEAAAVGLLTTKPKWKKSVRLMQVGRLDEDPTELHFRQIEGGVLIQEADVLPDVPSKWRVVTQAKPAAERMRDLEFSWSIARFVKSNAIVLAKDQAVCGVGAGQMSRVDAVRIAIHKAGSRTSGSVLASDAFFPFPDSIEKAAEAGIQAVIQPGGSKQDEEVIAACNAVGLPMIFTGTRHFKH